MALYGRDERHYHGVRGRELDTEPIPRAMTSVRVFHIVVLALTYGLALAFFPTMARDLTALPYFDATYLGSLGASVVLSLIAPGFGPGMGRYLVLFLRCYLLLILGYGIGSFLSAKLVLGIGLMAEIGILVPFPLNLVLSGLVLAVLAAAQAWPFFFGPGGLVETASLPGIDELAVPIFVLGAVALMTAWIGRLTTRQAELRGIIRTQDSNLEALAELNRNLQGYARTIDEVSSERERNRISREIHDISGYIFTNLIALMDAAGSLGREDQGALPDMLLTARKQAQEGLRETRTALRKLREEKPRKADSTRDIHRIVSIFRTVAGIGIDLSFGNLPHFLSRNLNLALLRTVQEALTNSVRHGRASQVRVNFWVADGELLLTIADNGKGAFEVVKGIGLAGMEERIGALGGTVQVGRAPEGGFSLSVQVPLATDPGPA